MGRQAHVAIYGNVAMLRGHCPRCESLALVIDDAFACCGESAAGLVAERKKRISEPEFCRKRPGPQAREEILKDQENLCFYCDRRFGSHVVKGSRIVRLSVQWDHWVPYSFAADNRAGNFVAACQICNGLKSNLHFMSRDEARARIALAWQERGWD